MKWYTLIECDREFKLAVVFLKQWNKKWHYVQTWKWNKSFVGVKEQIVFFVLHIWVHFGFLMNK